MNYSFLLGLLTACEALDPCGSYIITSVGLQFVKHLEQAFKALYKMTIFVLLSVVLVASIEEHSWSCDFNTAAPMWR